MSGTVPSIKDHLAVVLNTQRALPAPEAFGVVARFMATDGKGPYGGMDLKAPISEVPSEMFVALKQDLTRFVDRLAVGGADLAPAPEPEPEPEPAFPEDGSGEPRPDDGHFLGGPVFPDGELVDDEDTDACLPPPSFE